MTAIFVRKGAAYVDPLFGIWISMLTVAVAYGSAFSLASWHASARLCRRVFGLEVVASVLVATSTWIFWVAVQHADVGSVLALSLLQVPTAMLTAPIVAGRGGEEWTRQVLFSAALVSAGGVVVLVLA
jgi:uncharacterized membrane protein